MNAQEIAPCVPDFDREFLSFYDATKGEVYGFLLARSGDPTLTEDLMAETYLAALDALRRRKNAVTMGWLITVARRRLVDHWRRQTALRSKLSKVGVPGPVSVELELDARDTTILTALQSLPSRQRAAVTLRYVDELSVSEIADELGVGYKTAESLLSRGRASLGRAYEELIRDH